MNANDANELNKWIENSPYTEQEEVIVLLRQQQAEIEAMRNRFTLAFWHDTFVEVKKPNSDLIYRFKLDETNDS